LINMLVRGSMFAVMLALGAPSMAAAAQEAEQEAEITRELAPPADVATAARDGAFLPSTLSPRVGAVPVLVSTFGGYDTAHKAAIGTAVSEVRLWGPIALRIGVEYSPIRNEPRPTVGGRVQLLRQESHGIDGALGVFYRPEGFTEPEGEIETFASIGRRFERVTLLGNLVYGQDPEGNERDGEVRAGALYATGRFTLGLDARFRFAIGTQKGTMAAAEPKLDLLAGPVAMVAVGPLLLFAEAGPSLLKVTGETSFGVAAMGGAGAVF
jgi:hypothetical protein